MFELFTLYGNDDDRVYYKSGNSDATMVEYPHKEVCCYNVGIVYTAGKM